MKTQIGLFFALTALVFGMTLLVLLLIEKFHITAMQNILPLPW